MEAHGVFSYGMKRVLEDMNIHPYVAWGFITVIFGLIGFILNLYVYEFVSHGSISDLLILQVSLMVTLWIFFTILKDVFEILYEVFHANSAWQIITSLHKKCIVFKGNDWDSEALDLWCFENCDKKYYTFINTYDSKYEFNINDRVQHEGIIFHSKNDMLRFRMYN